MVHLTSKDYKGVLEIIEIAYSIPDRAAMFQAICEKLDRLIGISSAVLLPLDRTTKKFVFPGPITYKCSVTPALPYVLYYAPLDPLINRWNGLINNPVENTELLSPPILADSEFGRDFLSQVPCYYVIGAFLGSQGDPITGSGFHRQKNDSDFSDRDKKIMGLILPHISPRLFTI